MSADDRHYGRPTREPTKGSLFAYFVRGFEILDTDASPPLVLPCIPITSDMSFSERKYAERHNPFLAECWRHARREVADTLRAGGCAVSDPPSAVIAEIIDRLVAADFDTFDRYLVHAERAGTVPKRPAPYVRVIAMTHLAGKGCSPAKSAEFLMRGAVASQRSGRLGRDNVSTAFARYWKDLARMPNGLARRAELSLSVNQFQALMYVLRRAKLRQDFRCFAGAELADRIHASHDLRNVVGKAYEHVPITHPSDLLRIAA